LALDQTVPATEATKKNLHVHILRLSHRFKKDMVTRAAVQQEWNKVSEQMKTEIAQLESQKVAPHPTPAFLLSLY